MIQKIIALFITLIAVLSFSVKLQVASAESEFDYLSDLKPSGKSSFYTTNWGSEKPFTLINGDSPQYAIGFTTNGSSGGKAYAQYNIKI